MPKALSALLEFGEQAFIRTFTEVVATGNILKLVRLRHNLHHLPGVILPVGCGMEDATPADQTSHLLHEGRLQNTALAVLFLVPGIGEKEHHARK